MKMKVNITWKSALTIVILMVLLVGCGEPKADVTIFMMGSQGIPSEAAQKLESSLVAKVGAVPTIVLHSSPLFSIEKMIIEVAAGENGILIVPDEQFRNLGKQGGFVSLDDVIKPEEFPTGMMEITDQGKTEKHIYGIPLEDTKWMKELNFNGKGLIAFIPQNAKKQEEAKQVIKIIAEK
jgi:ABC-type glycerol-3-phosphate transport system substrate-binding protein